MFNPTPKGQYQVYKQVDLEHQIQTYTSNQNKATTSTMYNYILSKFLQYLQNNNIPYIDTNTSQETLKNYRTYLQVNTNNKSSTIDYYIKIIRNFMVSQLHFNIPTLKPLNSGKTHKIKYLTLEEVKGLVNMVDKVANSEEQRARDKALICTLFTTGLRISEALNLTINDYQTQQDVTYITIVGKGRATDEREPIVIPPQTINHINTYLEIKKTNGRKSQYLFSSMNDNQLKRQNVNRNLKKLAKAYDKEHQTNITPKVSSHSFRHSYARLLLINKGIPISQVKDLLRHSNIETTSQYLRNDQEELNQLRKSMTF